jgi:hypothetical protein
LTVPVDIPDHTPSSADQSEPSEAFTWIFFGTIIVALLLLFCLAFRYYARRDMKETEHKWKNACENFITRMDIERMNSSQKQTGPESVWTKILDGER